MAVLHEHGSKSIFHEKKRDNGQKPIYDLVRKRQAKVLLRRLKKALRRNNTEEFVKTVKYLAGQRKTVTGLKAGSSATTRNAGANGATA